MRIGTLLAIWRRRNSLTLAAAAVRIGIHPSTLARLEKGEAMHGATLATLLVWLMGREEPSNNETFAFASEDAIESKENSKECSKGDGEPDRAVSGRIEADHGKEAGEVDAGEDGTPGAAIAHEQETAAELPVHALDQDIAVCGVREE